MGGWGGATSTSSTTLLVMTSPRQICRLEDRERVSTAVARAGSGGHTGLCPQMTECGHRDRGLIHPRQTVGDHLQLKRRAGLANFMLHWAPTVGGMERLPAPEGTSRGLHSSPLGFFNNTAVGMWSGVILHCAKLPMHYGI